jgi:hypothetical protein
MWHIHCARGTERGEDGCEIRQLPSDGLCGNNAWPEVHFEAVNTRSNIFQPQVVIHRVSQFLFASQVVLARLHGYMAKQKLNLFKLAPGQVTESCAGAPSVMRSEILDVGTFCSRFDDVPDSFWSKGCAPYRS